MRTFAEFCLWPLLAVKWLKKKSRWITKERSLILDSLLKTPFTLQKKWVQTHKKVGMHQIFLLCKPSMPCFHEMDLDSVFSGFGVIGGYGSKTEKNEFGPLLLFKSAV